MSLSAESRAKISAALKGNRNAKGCKRSAETRRKVGAARKGKPTRHGPHSDETKARISAALKGVYASPKKRLALRIAQKVIELFRPDVLARKRAVSSAKLKIQMQDPVFCERLAAGRRAYWAMRRATP